MYSKSLLDDDQNTLLDKEKNTFQKLLETELTVLNYNKTKGFSLFCCNRNSSQNDLKLNIISDALAELPNFNSYEEFIVFREKFLSNKELIGRGNCGLTNSKFYNTIRSMY
jgi:hypothetical protein